MLCEDYYIASNKKSYEILLNNIKKREIIRNKLTTCYACSMLLSIGCESPEITDTLKVFGFSPGISHEELNRRLLREHSYLKLLDSQNEIESKKKDAAEVANFWRMISQYEEAVGRQVDVRKVSVARWIEMLKVLKAKNGRDKKGRPGFTGGN